MTDLEIPLEGNRKGHYRFFEILPGAMSWTLLFTPVILSYINVYVDYTSINLGIVFIIVYLLIFFARNMAYATRAVLGYRQMRHHMRLDWTELSRDIDAGKAGDSKIERPRWHHHNIQNLGNRKMDVRPKELYHAVIIATVNESREILEPTIQAVINSKYDLKKVILVIAYEGRVGDIAEARVLELIKLYRKHFKHAMAVKHPAGIPNEQIGKGGNITFAGRELQKYLKAKKFDTSRVLVTTLDSDNRPHPMYFAALSYLYCVVPDPLRASYQPLPMYTNNIWDAPTLMRVIATGNNLFYIVQTQRLHLQRNFSAHAQSMKALIEMDFWSVRTVVEDGHHFWRSYFRYDGDYRVYPISIPVYQDAVLAEGYWRTIVAQFMQLRRWTYGASDVAYIADKGFYHKNKAPKLDVLAKLLRTLEGHVSWATSTLIVLGGAFTIQLLHPDNFAAWQTPRLISRIQLVGLIGLLCMIYVCMLTLPPRPSRYKRHRSVLMVLQWVLTPITSIGFGSSAAFYSQTTLMFGKYNSKFDVTEKAVVKDGGKPRK